MSRSDWVWLTLVTGSAIAFTAFCQARFGTSLLEGVGFVTGIVAVYLVTREHMANWPIGIANVAVYAVFFWRTGFFNDAWLQVYYLLMQAHGWWSWAKGGVGGTELPISRMTRMGWVWSVGSVVVGTAVFVPILTWAHGAAPFWDAFLSSLSVVAQILLNRKVLENWALWMVANVCYVPLFFSRGFLPTALLYLVFLVLAVVGHVSWWRTFKAQGQPT